MPMKRKSFSFLSVESTLWRTRAASRRYCSPQASRNAWGGTNFSCPSGDETVIRKTAKAVLESAVSEVILVTGHEEALVRQAAKDLNVRLTHNPRYAQGQSTSMVAGVEAATEATGAYLFVLGDQPLLTPGIVNDMICPLRDIPARRTGRGAGLRGQARKPRAVLRLSQRRTAPDERGCGRQGNHPKTGKGIASRRIVFLHLPNDDIFLDIDTEKDYEFMLRKFPISLI